MGWFVQLFLILEKLKEKKCNNQRPKKNEMKAKPIEF